MDNKNYSVFFRSFEEDDAKLIHKWKNDFEMFEMTLGMNRKLSLKEVQEWVAEKMKHHHFEVHWAICLNDESQKMIGYTYLSNIHFISRSVEGGGLIIGDKENRDGITLFETQLLKLDYCFNTLNLNRYTGRCFSNHKTSNDMLLALNFKEEGVLRQADYKNGKYYDVKLYSILRDEYFANINNGNYEMAKIIKRFRALTKAKR
jgi:ribosomal-protein-alanine N-acetyltransferase